MKINPVKKYPGVLPAAAALLSSIVTGCDKQSVVGSVPDSRPRDSEQQHVGRYLITPTPEQKEDSTQPEEEPQALGGDVPDILPNAPED